MHIDMILVTKLHTCDVTYIVMKPEGLRTIIIRYFKNKIYEKNFST